MLYSGVRLQASKQACSRFSIGVQSCKLEPAKSRYVRLKGSLTSGSVQTYVNIYMYSDILSRRI